MQSLDPAGSSPDIGRNLTQGLVETLGRGIVTGEFEGKRFPTEAELAGRHGVSRSVTREAVKMLTAKGLLSARPRRGTIVEPAVRWNLFDGDVLGWLLERTFSLSMLRSFNELRLGIEPVAARLAAERRDEAASAAIRRGYDRMVAADTGYDDPLASDIAFHVAILRATNNPFFSQYEGVVSSALQTSIKFTNRFKGRSADLKTHERVLVSIEQGKPGAAEDSMRVIIQDVLTLIESTEGKDAEFT